MMRVGPHTWAIISTDWVTMGMTTGSLFDTNQSLAVSLPRLSDMWPVFIAAGPQIQSIPFVQQPFDNVEELYGTSVLRYASQVHVFAIIATVLGIPQSEWPPNNASIVDVRPSLAAGSARSAEPFHFEPMGVCKLYYLSPFMTGLPPSQDALIGRH